MGKGRENDTRKKNKNLQGWYNGYDGQSFEDASDGIAVITANGSLEEGVFGGIKVRSFTGLLEAQRFCTIPWSHQISEGQHRRHTFEFVLTPGNSQTGVGKVATHTANADGQLPLEQLRRVSGTTFLDLE